MNKIALYILGVVAFMSCNDDNDSHSNDATIDISLIYGEWVAPDAAKEYFSILNLRDSKAAFFSIIQPQLGNSSIYTEDKGNWAIYDTKTLSISLLNYNALNFDIVEVNNDMMRLRDVKYNTMVTFYHVVETIEMAAGQDAEILFLKSRNANFSEIASTNEKVVTVSDNGIVKAHQGGVAFVSIVSNENTVFAKFIVKSRVDRFAEETHNTIKEILDKYGDPDLAGQLSEKVYGIAYNSSLKDSEIQYVEYDFDIETLEIIRIITIYNSKDAHDGDWEYLNDNFYLIPADIDLYGKYERFWDNSFLITPFYNDGKSYINYINQDYNSYE
jgi:hypothetical protein